MTEKLPFKVSAKAARLIGRESVSNAEGALGELVKNTYDADASNCAICFANRFFTPPNSLSKSDYDWVSLKHSNVSEFYKPSENPQEDDLILQEENADSKLAELRVILNEFVDLWVIDNGTGMSAKTIKDNWMVIGTDFKEANVFSDDGRTRTGAKGIGRFALDRLGSECEIFSFTENNGAIHWKVNWGDFDGTGKTLDEVKAELSSIENKVKLALDTVSPTFQLGSDLLWSHFKDKSNTGTFIRVGRLRDDWDEKAIQKVEKSLGALIPPLDQNPLKLHLYSTNHKPKYSEVKPSVLEDYDYRMNAKFTGNKVEFEFYRNELIATDINPAVFSREDMQDNRFNKAAFKKKKVKYTKNISDIFPGLDESHFPNIENIGSFDLNLLFFKRSMPGGRDAEIYPYRSIRSGPRQAWLKEFGGIKIYRDNFIVRPYGEPNSKSFDWLSLGQRVAGNPAASSRKDWRVGPQSLAGTIHISRTTNPNLYDQLTREGLIENKTFELFRSLVLKMIQEFENDRSHIHFNLNEIYKEENKTEQAITRGSATAKRVTKSPEKATVEDAKTLAKAFEAQQIEIQELREEQSMLRSLATLGTVLVSFSHEMGQLQNAMGSRSNDLIGILDSYIGPDDFGDVKPAFHPYKILEDWADDDKKVKQWFTFALASIRADKRRRRWIPLQNYTKKSFSTWQGFLKPRKIDLDVMFSTDFTPKVMAFEIDLDSIFNNLLLNSVEALLSKRHKGERKIWIEFAPSSRKGFVEILYFDNGPGIHKSIKSPKKIFDFNVTTKFDSDGKQSGTGLGMWILDTVVREYGGTVNAYNKSETFGFKTEITLPIKGRIDG